MKKLLFVFFALCSQMTFAHDFLFYDNGEFLATRNADPFARMDRVTRVDTLDTQWKRDVDGYRFYVVWHGQEWTCRDGSMTVPASELPKTISKLDLLLVLREMGKLDAFFAWLEASGLKPFWDAAQLMTTDHPLYEQALESVQEALGLTDEERDEILERIAK